MSDFTSGRKLGDDLPLVPEADRLAELVARDAAAREPTATQKVEVASATVEELRETVAGLVEAAERVRENWTSGDLAGAVNDLETAAETGRETLRVAGGEVFGERMGLGPSPAPAVSAERETMTLDAIERDPMNAIKLDLPPDASRELLAAVDDVASHLAEQAKARSDEAHEKFIELVPERRGEFASFEHFMKEAEPAVPAGRETMTLEAIGRDPMNAITLDLPPDAGKELLGAVVDAATQIRVEALRASPDREDSGRSNDLAHEAREVREMAVYRLDQIAEREAWQAPAFSRETIEADPRTAVYLPVPAGADRELLEYARGWAADLERYAATDGAIALPSGLAHAPEQGAAAAAERIADLDGRLAELTREPMTLEAIERDPMNAVSLDLPPAASKELLGAVADAAYDVRAEAKHASRFLDIAFEAVTALTESLWRPSPAELHDLMRARDEQTEMLAIVAADREHAAALDEANWHINHNRNHARTEDSPRQAQDFFDRNPGLTQDAGADETRERENDRAFYDTGIERGR